MQIKTSSLHFVWAHIKSEKVNAYSIYFIVESEVTSSANPMLVFYIIFNEAFLLPKKVFSTDSILKQGIQMKINLRVRSERKV